MSTTLDNMSHGKDSTRLKGGWNINPQSCNHHINILWNVFGITSSNTVCSVLWWFLQGLACDNNTVVIESRSPTD